MVLTMLCVLFLSHAQMVNAQMKAGDVDIYAGVNFNYRDIFLRGRFMDLLINVTPGVKWNAGHRVQLEASALIPIVNQYGSYYKYVRINTATASWQFGVGPRWKTKISGGVFTNERFGFDIKTMYAFNSWLAVRGQIGLTGKLTMTDKWEASEMKRFTFEMGPEFWLNRYCTQMSLRGGHYLYGDYGAIAEIMRNFKHSSVGVFGQYSTKEKLAAGFKIIIMLPPYKRWCGKVHFRPAGNFRLTYLTQGGSQSLGRYNTDPEENERTGWFDRDLNPWGQTTMPADFKACSAKSESYSHRDTVTIVTTETEIIQERREAK